VTLIETSPVDPAAPLLWEGLTVNGVFETDGENLLTLDAATLTSWDSTREYAVIAGAWGDATTDQKKQGTWLADPSSQALDDGTVPQRWA
jgi:hypothetical protein